MGDGVRLALTTLTVAPVRGGRVDRDAAGRAMLLAPAVGLLLAVPALLVLEAFRFGQAWGTTHLLPAVLAVTVLAVLTRGLHLDGLADTTDGLASYRPPEEAQEVMRRGDVGALGAAAQLLVVLIQVAALEAAVESGHGTLGLAVAAMTGRLAVTWACRSGVRAARPEGLGALVAGTVSGRALAGCTALVLLAAAAGGAVDEQAGLVGVLRPVAAVVAGLVVAELLRRHADRRLGGLSGDVLGAVVEVATAAALVVAALSPPTPGL